jgi:hypothetical protein
LLLDDGIGISRIKGQMSAKNVLEAGSGSGIGSTFMTGVDASGLP